MTTELKKAIDLVNSVQRRADDALLVYYVTCERCGNGFAKMAQDAYSGEIGRAFRGNRTPSRSVATRS